MEVILLMLVEKAYSKGNCRMISCLRFFCLFKPKGWYALRRLIQLNSVLRRRDNVRDGLF